MKRLLLGVCREELLSTAETILKHWGYRVLASSKAEELAAFLKESAPDLLILGAELLADRRSPLYEAVAAEVAASRPLIVLGQGDLEIPHESLPTPLDIFALFEKVQKHLEKYPRKNLRLTLKLPGMISRETKSFLTEVLSLSNNGLFVKTVSLMEKGDEVEVVLPLLGMKKELDLKGRVLYQVYPGPENNYLQGIGIEFTDLNKEKRRSLEAFLEGLFLGEVSQRGGGHSLDEEQVMNHSAKDPEDD